MKRSYEKIRSIETRRITLKGRTVTEVRTTSNIKLSKNVNIQIFLSKLSFNFNVDEIIRIISFCTHNDSNIEDVQCTWHRT